MSNKVPDIKEKKTLAEQLAAFVVRMRYENISEDARQQLKIHILDSIGCAIGALAAPPVKALHAQLDEFGGKPLTSLIGGGKSDPVFTAFYNSALERYLDFMDSYIAKHETCHPADNMMSVLAASEYGGKTGKDFLTGVAVAYQVQCRLSAVAPVRPKDFDHTTQGAYAVAAGVGKALGLISPPSRTPSQSAEPPMRACASRAPATFPTGKGWPTPTWRTARPVRRSSPCAA